jgi:hypothetical protein
MSRFISFLWALVGGNSHHVYGQLPSGGYLIAVVRWWGPYYPIALDASRIFHPLYDQFRMDYRGYSITFRSTNYSHWLLENGYLVMAKHAEALPQLTQNASRAEQ